MEECKNEPRKIYVNTSRELLSREEHKNKFIITQSENSAEDLHRKEQTSKLKNTLMETSSQQLHRAENKNQLYDSFTDDLPNEQCDTRSHDSFTEDLPNELCDTRLETSKFPAPDGGYGWFVVLGCFISHVVFAGFDRSEGILFLLLTSKFEQSAQLTSWPGAIACTLQLLLGPLATAVSNRYSPRIAVMLGAVLVARTSVMIGGLLMSLGCILSGFATNFYFLFFSYALLVGTGRGLSYAPGLILVAMYFDKRRGLATSISSSGVGIGGFIIVLISHYLFENYEFQGAFLIIGGIALHTNLAAMLYRPMTMHQRFNERLMTHSLAVDPVETTVAIVASESSSSELDSRRPPSLFQSSVDQKLEIESPTSLRNDNANTKYLGQNPFIGNNCVTTAVKICFPKEIREDNNKMSRQLCHLYLLKNTPFLLYCISAWLFSMAMKSGYTFIQALVISKGISKAEAALVMSIAGLADCVSRIGAGFLLDLKLFHVYRLLIYTVISLSLALVLFLLPSRDSFHSFVVLWCVFGVLTGIFISQRVVILVDILGIQQIANSLVIVICFQSLGTLLGPPLSGTVKDYFGTVDELFYLNGMFMVTAGIFMCATWVFFRYAKAE
ncbi:unnamed protein product [Candidula unifasciata]|uniref:Major facilitator superfamily (MFS) profile domain-containing protein n=1 Tax=Candidula unifasciata TaxID=100452 RepID=A0A8S3ZG87_9EUPU|nr:unnamed protein product [Candidula unifasciata]